MCLHRHDHSDLVARYDHVNLGFSESELMRLHDTAGLKVQSLGVCTRERRKPYFEVLGAISSR
jgi:ArsR family transcriptional regulator